MRGVLSLALVLLCARSQEEERPPSKFKVGDEWLALPEVFSKLDFDADSTFAAPGDEAGQLRLRSTRSWGRMYVDGWPQSVQFFRAHFGVEPPLGRVHFLFAEPRDACSALSNADEVTASTVLLARRGECTFGAKALNARAAGSPALVVINNEPGLDHLPGPDAHDIDISVMSIPQPEGQLLEAVHDAGQRLEGFLVPINCEHSGAACLPATLQERDALRTLVEGGTLLFHGSPLPASELPVEYLLAHFGVMAPPANASFPVSMAKPADACAPLTNDVRGKLVVVRRGGCSFATKAEAVQAAGGAAVAVGSLHEHLVRMGVEPRWKGLGTAIPVLMVSKRAYSLLVAEAHSLGSAVSLVADAAVRGEVWEQLERLGEGQGWPRSPRFADKKHEELLHEHRAWPDRLRAIAAAYKKLSAEGGSEGPRTGEL